MKIKLSELEKETLSYNDVAFLVLSNYKVKMKIQELFKRVIKLLDKTNEDYEEDIEDFFLILTTDKRFIMTDKGFWHLKEKVSIKDIKKINDDEDDDEDEDFIIDEKYEDNSTSDFEESDEDNDLDVLNELKIQNEDDL